LSPAFCASGDSSEFRISEFRFKYNREPSIN
jgi:hypothetical protein